MAILWHIDPTGSTPIFQQIIDLVKAGVARGDLGAGDRLPSIRALAKRLSVNPNTVNKAYVELERDGVCVRRQGAGCFVGEVGSHLADGERERQLAELAERLVTEAYHLGFSATETRNALRDALSKLQSPRRKQSS